MWIKKSEKCLLELLDSIGFFAGEGPSSSDEASYPLDDESDESDESDSVSEFDPEEEEEAC